MAPARGELVVRLLVVLARCTYCLKAGDGHSLATLVSHANPTEKLVLEKIFYINVRDSVDRNTFMKQRLASNADGIAFERFEAVTKADVTGPTATDQILGMIKERNVSFYFDYEPHKSRLPGALACYMSHVQLLSYIVSTGYPDTAFLVVEDDTNITGGWLQELRESYKSMPKTWDFLKLGYWGASWICDETRHPGVFNVRIPGKRSRDVGCNQNFMGTQAYLITPKGAAKVLKYLQQHEIRDFDTLMCSGKLCNGGGSNASLQAFALPALKPFFKENTDLSTTIGANRYDQSACNQYLATHSTCEK